MFNLFINIYFNSLISGLVIIKLSNRIFILVLQNWPIRVKYLFDAVLLLAVFFSKYEYDLVLDSFRYDPTTIRSWPRWPQMLSGSSTVMKKVLHDKCINLI
jgi:hypothetical protein